MKFTLSFVVFATLLACVFAAPQNQFLDNIKAELFKFQDTLKNALANGKAKFDIKKAEVAAKLSDSAKDIQSKLQGHWADLGEKASQFGNVFATQTENLKQNFGSTVQEKKEQISNFLQKFSTVGDELVAKANAIKADVTEQLTKQIAQLKDLAQNFAGEVKSGEHTPANLIEMAKAKFETVKQELAEKIEQTKNYVQTVKNEAQKTLLSKVGAESPEQLIEKLRNEVGQQIQKFTSDLQTSMHKAVAESENDLQTAEGAVNAAET